MAEKKPETTTAEGGAAKGGSSAGGFSSWLPLVVTLVAMPALAYATTQFLIVPKLKQAASTAGTSAEESGGEADASSAESGHGKEEHGQKKESGHGSTKEGAKKGKQIVTLSKMIVNVSGTMGTRYLMATVTLVSHHPNFKNTIEENKDQLLDLAGSTLGGKTIADLEKPGARNQIKTELMSIFNNALGESMIKEIYIPEMAIQ